MKRALGTLPLVTVLLLTVPALAADKVVVVPLSSALKTVCTDIPFCTGTPGACVGDIDICAQAQGPFTIFPELLDACFMGQLPPPAPPGPGMPDPMYCMSAGRCEAYMEVCGLVK